MTEEKLASLKSIPDNILDRLAAFLRFAAEGRFSGHVTLRLHEGGVREIETTEITKADRKKI